MADIELVIKIPEEIYHDIKIGNDRPCNVRNIAIRAIKNGIPLPKGKWVNADNLKSVGHFYKCSNCQHILAKSNYCSNCGAKMEEEEC